MDGQDGQGCLVLLIGWWEPRPAPGIPRSLRSRPFSPTKGAHVLVVWLAGRPRGFAPTGVRLVGDIAKPARSVG